MEGDGMNGEDMSGESMSGEGTNRLEELRRKAAAKEAADDAWWAEYRARRDTPEGQAEAEERERRRREVEREKHSRAGKAGAAKRWGGRERVKTMQIRVSEHDARVLRELGAVYVGREREERLGVAVVVARMIDATRGALWDLRPSMLEHGKLQVVALDPLIHPRRD